MSKKKPIITPRPGPKLNRPTKYPSTPEGGIEVSDGSFRKVTNERLQGVNTSAIKKVSTLLGIITTGLLTTG